MALRLKANRRFPSIPIVVDDPANHTQVLMAVKEALDIGQRRTSDLLNSFIRVEDLIDLGLITIEGNTNSIVGADLSEIADIGDLSGAATGDFLRFDGSEWINDQLALTDITQAMVTQHQAALSIAYGQITGAPSIPNDISSATFITADDETATLANSLKLVAGSNVTFDTSTPGELEISASGGGGGGTVESVIGTTNEIDVDSSDPANPVVSLANAVTASLALADSAVQAGDLAAVAFSGDYGDLINTPSIPSAANPSASVGLSAVNGSANTFMRSDAAPALDQGISPTWTGEHVFTEPTAFLGQVSIGDGGTDAARLILDSAAGVFRELTFATAGVQRWNFRCQGDDETGSNAGSSFQILRRADDGSSLGAVLSAARNTGLVRIYNGLTNANGTALEPAYTFAADTDTGIYRVGANLLGFAAGGTQRAEIGSKLFVGLNQADEDGVTGLGAATVSAAFNNLIDIDRAGGTPFVRMQRLQGSYASPEAISSGLVVFQLTGRGYNGSGFNTGIEIRATSTETYSSTAGGTQLAIRLADNGTTVVREVARFTAGGAFALIDGVTAPAANITGMAQIYIDSADGDLKIRFADGTVKTIVTDT